MRIGLMSSAGEVDAVCAKAGDAVASQAARAAAMGKRWDMLRFLLLTGACGGGWRRKNHGGGTRLHLGVAIRNEAVDH